MDANARRTRFRALHREGTFVIPNRRRARPQRGHPPADLAVLDHADVQQAFGGEPA